MVSTVTVDVVITAVELNKTVYDREDVSGTATEPELPYEHVPCELGEAFMRKAMEEDPFGRELFLAGEAAPPGRYKRLDSWQVVELNQANILPAALDGHMTCYTRIEIWNDNQLSDVSIVLLPEANV